jgi:hypothetical protein
MKLQLSASVIALAVAFGIAACNTDSPTAPKASAPQAGSLERSGPKAREQSLTFDVTGPVTHGTSSGTFNGTMNVTKFGFDEATSQLTVTGVLNGIATFTDGTPAINVVNQVVTTTATMKRGDQTASTGSPYQFASMYRFTASCGILLLDLGPLHLDLLGLVIDLNEVILDITAESGANNLLGNLLCALTGLLDLPGAIAGIVNLIDSINNLLGGIGGLAAPAGSHAPLGGIGGLHLDIAVLRST